MKSIWMCIYLRVTNSVGGYRLEIGVYGKCYTQEEKKHDLQDRQEEEEKGFFVAATKEKIKLAAQVKWIKLNITTKLIA